MNWEIDEQRYRDRLESSILYQSAGKITKSVGLVYEAHLPGASIGSMCRIVMSSDVHSQVGVDAEVIGFKDKKAILMPYEILPGINNESLVVLKKITPTINVSKEFLGRVIDPKGNPIDNLGPIRTDSGTSESQALYQKPTSPLDRKMISEPIDLGVRAINGLLTIGKGQRMGIMAGSGVGKSVLLGMMARNTKADINVIALIGERGREVREFIERDLGPEALKRSVIIVATSDTSPLLRVRGAYVACAIAEYFRDQGQDVLMLMDSVTRFCMAQREIGLSLGEPPASKGYTPSVFANLPKVLERAGNSPSGSITGLYTVLAEGDDLDDPVADSARSYLDGHIVLSRRLAERNHFPAIEINQSTSRVMSSVIDQPQKDAAALMREWLAAYQQAEDLINIGAYVKGSNPTIDMAIEMRDRMVKFLRQKVDEKSSMDQTKAEMHAILRAAEAASQAPKPGASRNQKPAIRATVG